MPLEPRIMYDGAAAATAAAASTQPHDAPAPEAAHAIRAVAEEAAAAREAGEARTILFGLSGHGHFDMSAYDAYFAGKLEDIELSQSRIDAAIEQLPRVPAVS